ncbi:MAG: hypothetical protein GEU93_07825 [Propionibacteriales bacterium]|nr:hypothetical protein [Propionibacteriales bacterium]
MTTRSASESTALHSLDGRSRVWRHAFVYLWLTFSAVSALVGDQETAVVHVTSVALTAVLGGWYWWWHIAAPPRTRRLPDHAYLIGGLVIWAVLVALNPSFLLVGVSILAPYCFDSIRWALAVLTPFAGLWLCQRYQAGNGLTWIDVAVCLLVIASGAVVTGYVGTLARENAERQRLIDELQAAQTELAAAEREAGVLAERQRLARDIHDTLSQGFASIVMLLEAAEASLDAGHSARRQVAAALRSARENLAESRRVVWALRPDSPAAGRLPDAVGLVASQLETRDRAESAAGGDRRATSAGPAGGGPRCCGSPRRRWRTSASTPPRRV